MSSTTSYLYRRQGYEFVDAAGFSSTRHISSEPVAFDSRPRAAWFWSIYRTFYRGTWTTQGLFIQLVNLVDWFLISLHQFLSQLIYDEPTRHR